MLFSTPALALSILVQPVSYEAGVDARLDGRFDEAVDIFHQLSEQQPGNADVFLQLGLALTAQKDFRAAEDALRRALDLAPDYDDVRLALARLAYYRNELEHAAQLAAVLPDSQEAGELRARIERARETPTVQSWRVDVFAAYSELSSPLSPWREAGLALGRRLDMDRSLTGIVHWSRRFGEEDVYLGLNYAVRLPDTGSAWVELGGAPEGDFRERIALRGGYVTPSAPGGEGLQGTLEASAARYEAGNVYTLRPGIRHLSNGDGLRVGAKAILVLDENRNLRAGWAVSGAVRTTDRTRLILDYVDAPDSEDGRTSEVSSVALGLRYQMTADLGLYTAITHESRDAYDRTELTISVNRRF